MNKPNKQTIVPHRTVCDMMRTVPLRKIPGFGGKFGSLVESSLGVSDTVSALEINEVKMQEVLGTSTGTYVYNALRGISSDLVIDRGGPKSMMAAKVRIML